MQNLSIGVNVVSKGSPSRILRVLLISLGITIRPRSSTLLTMPVAFVYLSHFTDVGIRIPTGASALGMTQKYDSRSGYRKPLSLRASAHTGVAISKSNCIHKIATVALLPRNDSGSRQMPYNNFTNYAVSICKRQEIVPRDLLFQSNVI